MLLIGNILKYVAGLYSKNMMFFIAKLEQNLYKDTKNAKLTNFVAPKKLLLKN